MPWIAVPWKEDRQALGEAHNVRGIPTLIVMKKNGGVKTREGTSDVMNGLKDP
jgi:hypothetical protein